MYYGHSSPDLPESAWQTLEAHHKGVGDLAKQFAVLGAGETAFLLGYIHDTGKRSDSFQRRLHGKGGKVDHTSAAYQYMLKEWSSGDGKLLAQLLSYPLLGHHGGMADYGSQAEEGTLAYRISGPRLNSIPDWKSESIESLPEANKFLTEIMPYVCLEGRKPDPFATAFFIRMLYSCLVDADFIDTERFCSPDRYNSRPAWPDIHVLKERLSNYLHDKKFLKEEQIAPKDIELYADSSCGTSKRVEAIRLARQFMHQKCISSANERTGLFSLTMPTGGGKTLSSLSFALRHAEKHDLQRIIYVIPYTSIIEQNAEVFRQALGKDAVLEHHSNFSYPEDGDDDRPDYMLSTENWDASVIVTTSVQFFESLFDNRPSKCRKLHNIAKSVIVLDEVQMLPVPYMKPCIKALKLLTTKYGCSVVLCTATQPALLRSSFLDDGFEANDVLEIIPRELHSTLFNIFRRATVEQRGIMDDNDLANTIMAEKQVLCIVNSRKHAGELFDLLEDKDTCYHLSARMTPDHRTKVLAEIRQRLSDNLPCRVVSTSLIECGVDISFPVVMREKNGLDVLAQSAGRCNREGSNSMGRIICFSSEKPLPKRAAELARRRTAFDAVAGSDDLFSPDTITKYFDTLYGINPELLDENKILSKTNIVPSSKDCIWQFQFKSIARKFHFIEDDTVNVVIDKGDAADLLQKADEERLSSAILRKLQLFSVQVRRYELERMQKDGRIEIRYGFLPVLSGGLGYDKKTGLNVTLDNGVAVEDLMF